ncbi:collagenase [Kitasatospora sp. NPDC048239]|uniref:collagenase n=1 Tax=unclassified Kitasatospora TaxID=2633591 RepID=UPI00371637E7
MSSTRRMRTTMLSIALAATLAAPLVQSAQAAGNPAAAAAGAASAATPGGAFGQAAYGPDGEVAHQAAAPAGAFSAGPGGWPGAAALQPTTAAPQAAAPAGTAPVAAAADQAAPCTVERFSALTPGELADFLADRRHPYQECLLPLLTSWDARFAKVMTGAHVRAVADRISDLAPSFDSADNLNQRELWYFLHVAVLFDFYHHDVIDIRDAVTTAALDRAIARYTANPRVFEPTTAAGSAMGELLQTGTMPTLRLGRIPLVKRVLGMFAPGSAAVGDYGWNWAVQSALQLNFQGVYNEGDDPQGLFRAAVAADTGYREAFRAYAGYRHLKGTGSEWAAGDAMLEYGRFSTIDALKSGLRDQAGQTFTQVTDVFGRLSKPWASLGVWLNEMGTCGQYNVCRADVQKEILPNTYSYDNGGLIIHTPLDRATADQLYYATKQVKAQFFRVIGTDRPVADDPNPTLEIQLYGTKSSYINLQNLLFGIGDVNNGGMFVEGRSTFYTYQRTSEESYFSLEELFRHEYTHYLNARWAIPGPANSARWTDDSTFAMNEGTAEYFAGSTRDGGVKARKMMVNQIASVEGYGAARLTIAQILQATWASRGFTVYPYAATFFNLLGEKHPDQLAEMYRLMRADDRAGYDAWRDRLGRDAALQREYSAFLDAEIPLAEKLLVPVTRYAPNGSLQYAYASEVQAALAAATSNSPTCKDNGDWNNKMRFTCTGRITANLTNAADAGRVRGDMAGTVDYFLLGRGGAAANNLADMNCWFGKVDVWPSGQAGTADYTCEGPLRR